MPKKHTFRSDYDFERFRSYLAYASKTRVMEGMCKYRKSDKHGMSVQALRTH